MIYRNKKILNRLGLVVQDPQGRFISSRFLVKKDHMGLTLTETIIKGGSTLEIQYLRHLEACYCIKGEGQLDVLENGKVVSRHQITQGSLYAPNQHDHHIFRCEEDVTLVCVFLPALVGGEIHNKVGSYD